MRKVYLDPENNNHRRKFYKELFSYKIDSSHLSRKRTYSNCSFDQRKPLESIFIEHSKVGSGTVRKYLLDLKLKIFQCENCLLEEWNSKKIPLELHHINGNRFDNRLENLQLLCCNCHAQTDTYKVQNAYKYKPK
jgi:hypothetical protein